MNPEVVKKDFYYDSKVGWYLSMQLRWNGEDWFLCQQLPQYVTDCWLPVPYAPAEDKK